MTCGLTVEKPIRSNNKEIQLLAITSGIITQIKTRPTKFGDQYDIYVNSVQYGFGKYPPRNVKEGDFVTFEFEEKQNGQYTNRNINSKTLRVDAGGAYAAQAPTATATPTAPVRVSVTDDRQKVISKQSAQNTALTFLQLLLANGAIKVPAKAPDAYTLLNTMFADYAARLYEINTGEKWNLTANDLTGAAAAKPVNSEQFAEDDIPEQL